MTTATRQSTRRAAAPASVLYDVPGPRARRVTLISSVLATIVVAVLGWWFVFRPLREAGQFSMELWGPIIDPSNDTFVPLWRALGRGARHTLIAAALAIIGSLAFGSVLALLRVQLKSLARRRYPALSGAIAASAVAATWLLNAVTRVFVEVFRGMPVVITIFFVFRILPEISPALTFSTDAPWYLVIGLTLYNMVVIAEILRSGMEGLPRGQREAALSIGLSPSQTSRLVLLPQAYRVMLPALISQLVVVLKDTSLGFIISYPDLLQTGRQASQLLNNPIQMYFTIGVIFIVVNYGLSRLARYTQQRMARGRRTVRAQIPHVPPAAGVDAGGGAAA